MVLGLRQAGPEAAEHQSDGCIVLAHSAACCHQLEVQGTSASQAMELQES